MSILLLPFLCLAPLADCGNVQDRDKGSFEDRRPILLDANNDGIPDMILPRTYSIKVAHKRGSYKRTHVNETHWIAFDLKMAGGHVLRSFFRYQYGDNQADYWVYAITPCVNRTGELGLLFYAGDDSSDTTILLRNRRGKFIVVSRRTSKERN